MKKDSSFIDKVKKCATSMFHLMWQKSRYYYLVAQGISVQQKEGNASCCKDATDMHVFTTMHKAQIPS